MQALFPYIYQSKADPCGAFSHYFGGTAIQNFGEEPCCGTKPWRDVGEHQKEVTISDWCFASTPSKSLALLATQLARIAGLTGVLLVRLSV